CGFERRDRLRAGRRATVMHRHGKASTYFRPRMLEHAVRVMRMVEQRDVPIALATRHRIPSAEGGVVGVGVCAEYCMHAGAPIAALAGDEVQLAVRRDALERRLDA